MPADEPGDVDDLHRAVRRGRDTRERLSGRIDEMQARLDELSQRLSDAERALGGAAPATGAGARLEQAAAAAERSEPATSSPPPEPAGEHRGSPVARALASLEAHILAALEALGEASSGEPEIPAAAAAFLAPIGEDDGDDQDEPARGRGDTAGRAPGEVGGGAQVDR